MEYFDDFDWTFFSNILYWTIISCQTNNVVKAGATGSLKSSSNALNSQVLSWESIFAQLSGIAAGAGTSQAQANTNLKAGNAQNGNNISLISLVCSFIAIFCVIKHSVRDKAIYCQSRRF